MTRLRARVRQSGQTLIIALIILGVLLIVGFVFLGIVNRNIIQQGTNRQRTLGGDLAEAGIRYAHQQLLTSDLGADWRSAPTKSLSDKDPDVDLLGKPAQYPYNGADGLGPWTRLTFTNGRVLIRVRYGPTDLSALANATNTANAKNRSYLIIEAYGRPGLVSATDPTLTGGSSVTNQKKLVAFCPIGLTETARFITNKYRVTRPAEIGVSNNLGLTWSDGTTTSPITFPLVQGTQTKLLTFGGTNTLTSSPFAFGGGFFSNADLRVHGEWDVNLSKDLGDAIDVAGIVNAADSNSKIKISESLWSAGNWSSGSVTYGGGGVPLDSRDSGFETSEGMLRDGVSSIDFKGFPRGVSRKEPPSITTADPSTGVPRYLHMSRDSGVLGAAGNTGRFGYGRCVYVNNSDDLQVHTDEQGRINTGTAESLTYDWTNPNNGQANSGWQGPFYVPRGAYVRLLSDGFYIFRDSLGPVDQRTWKMPDGTDSGTGSLRYRIGKGTDNRIHIVNAFTAGLADINAALAQADYSLGPVFDGVLFFEGNVRVRGVIPTNRQLTLVSNGTIYIEGSITKGIIDDSGNLLTQPSASSLALLARQYVCLNTSQFFGPANSANGEIVRDVPSAVGYAPIRLRQPDGSINLTSEILLDPTTPGSGDPKNPSSWKPYALRYGTYGTTAGHSSTYVDNLGVILTHTMDDGPAAATYFGLNVNSGLPKPTYLFSESADNAADSIFGAGYVTPGYTVAGYVPDYGLGVGSWQRYPKFETTTFPLVDAATSAFTTGSGNPPLLSPPAANGLYGILGELSNDFTFTTSSIGSGGANDYLIARAGLMPHDVRIEATIFAEEGSFFVIPGPWFNPNPNDRRDTYPGLGATDAERQINRKNNFGNNPEAPFYGEPIDVRVQIIGAVSENMPPDIAVQGEWQKKWGWVPRELGASGKNVPDIHAAAASSGTSLWVPNLSISYDPMLATGRPFGFDQTYNPIRTDDQGRPLPPLPRLPVSPALAYFGEAN